MSQMVSRCASRLRPRSSRLSRAARVGLAGVAVLGVAGCVTSTPRFTAEQVTTAAHEPGSALSVESGNGSVTVEAVPVGEVRVRARLRSDSEERVHAARLIVDRQDDGSLRVAVEWPDGKRRPNEGASLRVELPDARGVSVRTSNASVRLVGLSGPAEVSTSNAGVGVFDHAGDLRARTTNGPVRAERVTGTLDLSSSNSSVTVVEAGGSVIAETSNAGVRVSLAPESPGPVRVRTSNGSVWLGVGPAFAGRLRAETSNGSVTFDGLRDAEVIASHRESGEVAVGDSPAESSIRTTNGSVRVRGPEPSGGR